MKTFKPQLCPNEQIDLGTIKYPLLASFKLDGIRCIVKDGELCLYLINSLINMHFVSILYKNIKIEFLQI